MDLGNLLRLYSWHKSNAAGRNIPYQLTFKQWLDVWGERILEQHRGKGDDRLRLERIDKAQGYSVGNVHLAKRQTRQTK